MEKSNFISNAGQCIAIFFLALIFCAGCTPSYPKAKVAESVTEICNREYGIDVQAKLVGKTIVVFFPLDELFDSKLDILPGAIENIENVIQSTSRVVLSTDAGIDFYMVIAADTKNTAAEVILIRYIEDLYKFMYNWISREEYRKRVLWQINFNPRLLKSSTFDFDVTEVKLPSFLARQITQRINTSADETRMFRSKVNGVYNKQKRQFIFSLTAADTKRFQNLILPSLLHEIAVVLKAYNFLQFEQVEITNLFSDQTVTVSSNDLWKYLSN